MMFFWTCVVVVACLLILTGAIGLGAVTRAMFELRRVLRPRVVSPDGTVYEMRTDGSRIRVSRRRGAR